MHFSVEMRIKHVYVKQGTQHELATKKGRSSSGGAEVPSISRNLQSICFQVFITLRHTHKHVKINHIYSNSFL